MSTAERSTQIVYFVATEVYPWEKAETEYFATAELANRVYQFYLQNRQDIWGGINLYTGEAEVTPTQQEVKLAGTDIVCSVENGWDIEKLARNVKRKALQVQTLLQQQARHLSSPQNRNPSQ